MAHLIDKDALVAEIEIKFQKYWKKGEESDALQDGNAKYWGGVLSCLNEVKTLIDTLEVKEVDLVEEITKFFSKNPIPCEHLTEWPLLKNTAIHFFELGLKTSNVLTWEDMKQIRDIMVECSAIGLWSKPDEEYYQEVVKRFKAQKGE